MIAKRCGWAGVALGCALVTGVVVAGCSDSGGSSPPPTSGSGGQQTQSSSQVGSPYWYQGDAFGNPYKTHDASEAGLAQDVLTLVNQERAAQGLPGLLADADAERAAKVHTEDMLGRSYFSHVSPEGWDPADRLQMIGASGYTGVGENIAQGQTTAQQVMDAWMNSSGHRANILDPDYTHLGVGVAAGSGATTWAQVFLIRP